MTRTKEKWTVGFTWQGKFDALPLCAFCRNGIDLRAPECCEHFAEGYDDNVCASFHKVENMAGRLEEALHIYGGK